MKKTKALKGSSDVSLNETRANGFHSKVISYIEQAEARRKFVAFQGRAQRLYVSLLDWKYVEKSDRGCGRTCLDGTRGK